MKIRIKDLAVLLIMQFCLLLCLPASAQMQSKPRWVQKGEKSMDRQRSNESYRFKVFNTYDVDVNKLMAERFNPLLTYVRETYQADLMSLRLDSLRLSTDTLTTYRVSFTDPSGDESVVYARLVDDHCSFEDYANNTYQFEYYQLYAVSEKDSVPTFDEFELTRTYTAKAMCLSLVPGLGQIYKGQKAKGYVIMGAEATLLVSAIAFNFKQQYCHRQISREPEFADSWRSKTRGWRQMRNLSLCLAGGLYVYNLIDAAVAKGARQVVVRKPDGRQLSLLPIATPDGAGLTLAFRF